MDDEVEASAQRVRDHLRRPLAGSRDLLMKTAGNTVSEIVPHRRTAPGEVLATDYGGVPDLVVVDPRTPGLPRL